MGQNSSSAHNVVVLGGTVTNEPARRSLKSGSDVVNFDLSTTVDDRQISVPVAWYDPSESALSSFAVDEEVVIVGTVRRRFFRSGGLTQSRTEVVVDSLLPARRAKSVRSLRAAAAGLIRPADE
ncbi:single-stranded DNA-binding protein [Ilumatobacter sp.]|uniref:single-stranded DNA-binding protein n=1 Tax=Ilumatobacter sp. TaxID=1967498 RepID=UPI003C48EC0E